MNFCKDCEYYGYAPGNYFVGSREYCSRLHKEKKDPVTGHTYLDPDSIRLCNNERYSKDEDGIFCEDCCGYGGKYYIRRPSFWRRLLRLE